MYIRKSSMIQLHRYIRPSELSVALSKASIADEAVAFGGGVQIAFELASDLLELGHPLLSALPLALDTLLGRLAPQLELLDPRRPLAFALAVLDFGLRQTLFRLRRLRERRLQPPLCRIGARGERRELGVVRGRRERIARLERRDLLQQLAIRRLDRIQLRLLRHEPLPPLPLLVRRHLDRRLEPVDLAEARVLLPLERIVLFQQLRLELLGLLVHAQLRVKHAS
ncbi:hypothetical protein L1887_62384 [Cichorium endivia]|nr:hypothetical protein L1887_62384 [Cichorium endivia]